MARTRKSQKRQINPLILIFSSGETEINYFRLKKGDLRGNRNIRIEALHSNRKTAVDLVSYAKQNIKAGDYNRNKNDKVFLVMDLDDARDGDIKSAMKKMPENMNLIISNPDFEFWFLLHYRYYQDNLACREPIEKLRQYERNYDKPDVDNIYNSLRLKEKDAIKNAERLRKFHETENQCPDLHSVSVNPYTNVDELISFLNSL